ncbi:MAG: ParB/RepB/Spo0J family partition protein [Candidatus Competibacteraceae bacterium]
MLSTLELYRLQISALRPRVPLPWPTVQELTVARQVGLVPPVVVRPLPGDPQCYEILSGLKHWLLAQRAPLATVPAQIVTDLSDEAVRLLVEQDACTTALDPITEARLVQARVEQGLTDAAAGREIGRSRTATAHLRRLLRLAPTVQAQVAQGALSPGTARALVGLSERQQVELAGRIIRERLTTRQVEALARAWKTGHTAEPTTIPDRVPARDPDLMRLESELADRLGTPVTITYGGPGQGRLVIDFATLEILDGILEKIAGQRSRVE